MDDNTQQVQQPTVDPVVPAAIDSMSSMNDVAGMTPPPAPVMPESNSAAAEPVAPMDMPAAPVMDMPKDPMPAAKPTTGDGESDYSYAEDVLNEILDALDRIEAKLEAMGKKQG